MDQETLKYRRSALNFNLSLMKAGRGGEEVCMFQSEKTQTKEGFELTKWEPLALIHNKLLGTTERFLERQK